MNNSRVYRDVSHPPKRPASQLPAAPIIVNILKFIDFPSFLSQNPLKKGTKMEAAGYLG